MKAPFSEWRSTSPSIARPGRRGHLPLRVAPMLLVGMILLVLGVLSTAAL